MKSNKEKLINAIVKIAEDNDFQVRYDTSSEGVTSFEFSKFTSMGQDFSLSVSMQGNDITTFIEDLNEYYQSYDPEEETMLWLDDRGHGKNGAPYHMRDILSDMEECEGMINDLLESIIFENIQQELWDLAE